MHWLLFGTSFFNVPRLLKMRDDRIKRVRKIGVLKSGAIGDFIVTLPAFQALRDTYPTAEIVLLGRAWHESFAVGRTPIDRVVLLPPLQGITEGAYDKTLFDHFLREMQDEQFDVVLNFQGNGLSANPVIREFNARVTVGTRTTDAAVLDRTVPYYYYQSEVNRYLEIVRLIGATTNCIEPRLTVLEEDHDEMKAQLGNRIDQTIAILNPVATDPRRMWPLENYPALGERLAEKGFKIIFNGGVSDRQIVDGLIASMNVPAVNACGLSLGAFAALASVGTVTISPDTGPLHVAQAVQCPTVGLYWAPNLINWGPVNRRIHRPLISWQLNCPYCDMIPNDPYPFLPVSNCSHEISFVRDIKADDVIKEVVALVEQRDDSRIKSNQLAIQNDYAE